MVALWKQYKRVLNQRWILQEQVRQDMSNVLSAGSKYQGNRLESMLGSVKK